MTDLPKTENLELELEDGWLRIWLNRPAARNALSDELIGELREVLESIDADRTVRGITLRGRGGVFCAGADLKGVGSMLEKGAEAAGHVANMSHGAGELFSLLDQVPQVLLILVEGAAMAGGLGIVCTGDVVAVTRDAKFALTETTLGLAPAQIAPYVVQRLGLRTARRLMLTAARFHGEEAFRIGLADYLVDDAAGLDRIEAEVREHVKRCAPGANAVTKELVLAAPRADREEMIDLAGKGFAKCLLGEEGHEGIKAFLEKRKPSWAE